MDYAGFFNGAQQMGVCGCGGLIFLPGNTFVHSWLNVEYGSNTKEKDHSSIGPSLCCFIIGDRFYANIL